jgi:hypothetical protein
MTSSLRTLFCMLLAGIVSVSAHASDRLDPVLLKSVLRIQGPPDDHDRVDTGGGFLMALTENGTGNVFLITNKHMIGDWNYADADFHAYKPWINVFFYRTGDPSGQNVPGNQDSSLEWHWP